jgi:prepilin-type N-terminal cleavage/methylation domain-containing protein/prepilin-type processing-associated H-X9-DG protein
MKTIRNASGSGFTLVELLCVVALVVLIAAWLSGGLVHARERAKRMNCTDNLKQIGSGLKSWALDSEAATNNLNRLAADGLLFKYFLTLSNTMSSPKILFCPAESDPTRKPAPAFSSLTNDNQISYFIGLNENEETPQMLLSGDHNIKVNGHPAGHGVHALRTNDFLAWTQGGHQGQGNILLGDGSVQQISSLRLNQMLPQASAATNSLAFP